MPVIKIEGMHGLGDNLHQRAIVKHYMQDNEVWLDTPWPSVYHDLIGPNLKLVSNGSTLRTQAKNAQRERGMYETDGPIPERVLKIMYSPQGVREHGSVLAAMCHHANSPVIDFSIPIKEEWSEKVFRLINHWKPSKPVMVFRPLVERKEWGGCKARNPDFAAYKAIYEKLAKDYFVISIADLEKGKEWLAMEDLPADVKIHRGELEFGTIAAMISRAELVLSSPGFAIALAQAVGTKSICVFGGYENSASFSAGATGAKYLGIDTVNPCQCFSHHHTCDKRIDIDMAFKKIEGFRND